MKRRHVGAVAVATGIAGGETSLFITGIVGGHSLIFAEICRNCPTIHAAFTRSMLLAGVSWGQIVISNLPIPGR